MDSTDHPNSHFYPLGWQMCSNLQFNNLLLLCKISEGMTPINHQSYGFLYSGIPFRSPVHSISHLHIAPARQTFWQLELQSKGHKCLEPHLPPPPPPHPANPPPQRPPRSAAKAPAGGKRAAPWPASAPACASRRRSSRWSHRAPGDRGGRGGGGGVPGVFPPILQKGLLFLLRRPLFLVVVKGKPTLCFWWVQRQNQQDNRQFRGALQKRHSMGVCLSNRRPFWFPLGRGFCLAPIQQRVCASTCGTHKKQAVFTHR